MALSHQKRSSVALEFQQSSVVFWKAPRTNIIFNFGVCSADISNPKRSQKQALKKAPEMNPLENISERVHG